MCTPGTGVNLWGDLSACNAQAGSLLYVNPVNMLNILTKVLAEGNRLRNSFAGQEGDLKTCGIHLSGVA